MSDDDNEDTFAKGCALIQSNLGINPDTIDEAEEWAVQYTRALWLERWRNRHLAELLESLFRVEKNK